MSIFVKLYFSSSMFWVSKPKTCSTQGKVHETPPSSLDSLVSSGANRYFLTLFFHLFICSATFSFFLGTYVQNTFVTLTVFLHTLHNSSFKYSLLLQLLKYIYFPFYILLIQSYTHICPVICHRNFISGASIYFESL